MLDRFQVCIDGHFINAEVRHLLAFLIAGNNGEPDR